MIYCCGGFAPSLLRYPVAPGNQRSPKHVRVVSEPMQRLAQPHLSNSMHGIFAGVGQKKPPPEQVLGHDVLHAELHEPQRSDKEGRNGREKQISTVGIDVRQGVACAVTQRCSQKYACMKMPHALACIRACAQVSGTSAFCEHNSFPHLRQLIPPKLQLSLPMHSKQVSTIILCSARSSARCVVSALEGDGVRALR